MSAREHEVLRGCLAGVSISDIANMFAKRSKTISTRKNLAYRPLGFQSGVELFGMLKSFPVT